MKYMKKIHVFAVAVMVLICSIPVIWAVNNEAENNEHEIYISGQLPNYAGSSKNISLIVLKDGKTYADYLNNTGSIENAAVIIPDDDGKYEYRATVKSNLSYCNGIISAGGRVYEKIIEFEKQCNLNPEIHVSTQGNDSGTAGLFDPLKTPEAARNMAKTFSDALMPVDVVFHGGEYTLNTAFLIDENYSGTAECPITYRAYNGDKPTFIGTKRINVSGFEKITDEAILARLPESSKNDVLQINLTNNNIRKYDLEDMIYWLRGSTPTMEGGVMNETGIFLNGKKQMLSRWPNSGYAIIGNTNLGGKYVQAGGIPFEGEGGNTDVASFSYAEDNPSRWTQAKDLCIAGYLSTDWAGEWAKVRSIDPENKKITLNSWTAYGVKKGYRWSAVNLLEEIDIPGEWYIDNDTMTMYYYPPHKLDASRDVLEITTMKNDLFKLTNAQYVNFENLNFERLGASNNIGRSESIGNGIEIISGNNIKVSGCNFENIGRNGVKLEGTNIEISGNTFYNIGYNAVLLVGGGDRATLTSGNNVISNNMISNVNTVNATGEGGILILGGVGALVEHNVIHNSAAFGINYAGNENIIRYNEVYRTNTNQNDAGAIYAGRNWSQYGTIIEYNYIHDLQDIKYNDEALVTSAVYWDDSHSGNTARKNIIVYNSKANSTFLRHHGGRDNLIENNIIVNSKNTISATAGWYWYSLEDLKEIVQYKSLREVPYDSEPFLTKYPKMSQIYSDIERDGRMISSLSSVGNVSVDVDTNDIHPTVRFNDSGNRLELKDYSIFVNPLLQDYRIKKTSKQELGLPDGVLDEDFDISLIGRQNISEESHETFSPLYPQNETTLTNKEKLEFVWESAKFADEYTLLISRNNSFSDIVEEVNTRACVAEVENLPVGKYYWKVIARNISRQSQGTWESAVNTFGMAKESIKITSTVLAVDGSVSESISGAVRPAKLTANIYSSEKQNIKCIAVQRKPGGAIAAVKIKDVAAKAGDNSVDISFNTCGTNASLELIVWDENYRPLCGKLCVTDK